MMAEGRIPFRDVIRRGAVDSAGSAGFLFLSSAKGGGAGWPLLRFEICNLPRQVRRVDVRVAFQAAQVFVPRDRGHFHRVEAQLEKA